MVRVARACGVRLAFWPYGAIAIAPQAILLLSILFVTGIPPTEMQAIRSRGDAYRAYQKRVSKFVPWPPKPPDHLRSPPVPACPE